MSGWFDDMSDTWLSMAALQCSHRLDNEHMTPQKRFLIEYALADIHTEMLKRKLGVTDG